MNLIQDIRFFSEHPDPILAKYHIHGMKDILQRLLFLLRHEGFTFGDFDHLYMNYTPSLPHGEVRRSQRPIDRYHPWLRYVDAGCVIDAFASMTVSEQQRFLTQTIQKAVHLHADEENRVIFDRCYQLVMHLGPALEIPYKEKSGEHLRITVSTTIDDDARFHPIVRIFDKGDQLLLEEHLKSCGRESFLAQFGTITLGKRTVRIEPRKSDFLRGQKVGQLKYAVK